MEKKNKSADGMHRIDDASTADGGDFDAGRGDGEAMTVIDAQRLFGSAREIGLRHGGSLYRLKITRHGKLILNK